MTRRTPLAHFLPWAGLIGSFTGLALVHQWGSDGNFDGCWSYSSASIGLILLAGLLVSGLGAFSSLLALREDQADAPRRFIAYLSLGCAALFAVAMTLPFVASLLIPACAA